MGRRYASLCNYPRSGSDHLQILQGNREVIESGRGFVGNSNSVRALFYNVHLYPVQRPYPRYGPCQVSKLCTGDRNSLLRLSTTYHRR